MNGVAILGSARSDGNTAKILARLVEGCGCALAESDGPFTDPALADRVRQMLTDG